MGKTILTGKVNPKESAGNTVVGKTIEYGIVTPSSGFDKRADVGAVSYVGESRLETRKTKGCDGNCQSKKHTSVGKGQS